MVMLVLPSWLREVICVMPAMRPNMRSSGVATAEAIVSGLAPGRLANTVIVGYSTSGRRRDRKKREGQGAKEEQTHAQQGSRNRPLDKWSRNIHGWPPLTILPLCSLLPRKCSSSQLAFAAACSARSIPPVVLW